MPNAIYTIVCAEDILSAFLPQDLTYLDILHIPA